MFALSICSVIFLRAVFFLLWSTSIMRAVYIYEGHDVNSVCCQVAARTLGDIVRKLGEKVLPEIIPILEQGLESEKSRLEETQM